MYASYKNDPRVAMYLVYLQEAHPAPDEEGGPVWEPAGAAFAKHRTLEQRMSAAQACVGCLGLTLPVLADTMEAAAGRAFKTEWATTVVLDFSGKVAYFHEGDDGVQPAAADTALRRVLEQAPPAGRRFEAARQF